jgi:hypothetical protein
VASKRGIAPDAHGIPCGSPREARHRDDVGSGLGVNNRRGDDREEGDWQSRQKSARSAKCGFHGSLTSNEMHSGRPNRKKAGRNGPRARKRVATRSKSRRSTTVKRRRAELRPKRRRRIGEARQVGAQSGRLEHPNRRHDEWRGVNKGRDKREGKRNVVCRRERVRTTRIVVGLR